jgi:hypothetical protein
LPLVDTATQDVAELHEIPLTVSAADADTDVQDVPFHFENAVPDAARQKLFAEHDTATPAEPNVIGAPLALPVVWITRPSAIPTMQ